MLGVYPSGGRSCRYPGINTTDNWQYLILIFGYYLSSPSVIPVGTTITAARFLIDTNIVDLELMKKS